MVRGPKHHLKRLNAPSHWMLSKMGGVWAPRPSAGPHKLRECIPMVLLLRNRLKYALTRREAIQIVMQRLVKVDGKVRTDVNYPTGVFDVVQIDRVNDTFRLIYDTKGRFTLHRINEAEASFKLCRVVKNSVGDKDIPYIATNDGRTFRYSDPTICVNDTVKVDLASGKVVDFAKFEVGNVAIVTGGANIGRVGEFVHRERHPGAFDIIHLRDAAGHEFSTRIANVFVIGKGKESWISLPKDKGVKKSIIQERDARLKK
ncbi:40S small subunit ribosomal protein eS4 (rpS4) [Andalucia godoyi]|uniref:40S ribosomal protein S4 n=1 Tax=Andalucia godoyi TaxID=505711 RepID=A0A8K0AIT6_ANDGO|nr:40S small subunit ribosomal protein eS4 (rpS4) [Andalucia godoyi]|eukprot:ANDGO_06039.mRNA.1 40S small subunit ribosomal protein eS4 (rpS4)